MPPELLEAGEAFAALGDEEDDAGGPEPRAGRAPAVRVGAPAYRDCRGAQASREAPLLARTPAAPPYRDCRAVEAGQEPLPARAREAPLPPP
ncbi:unnamed protein product, partial [Prorocentrum cordatum]